MKYGIFLCKDKCNCLLTKKHHINVVKKKPHIMLYDIWMVATIIPNKINKKTGIGLYRIKRSRKYLRPCRITSYYSIKFDIIKQCIIKHHLNTLIHMMTTCKHHKFRRLELLRLTENFKCRTKDYI